ncbi:kinase-like protein [Lentithecium fluviatile CBS 122367]|uniref:non-specific serine/threonine protein kinase n=1 Tax=Lentithecium fluviatile CBS 122367 TaxID=1168545 RepID=A0A6G1J828_9PLEO|nr:kinase-like protein [Lentithecium fluviatile CBS 122367]
MLKLDDSDQAMLAWFPPVLATPITERRPFSETDLRGISEVLHRTGRVSWSCVPRLYATLRIIGQLPAIDDFLNQGLTDVWFPLSHKTLPASLKSQAARCDFLDAQKLVLTKALDLEKEDGKHRHFSNPDDIPLRKVAELGKGGFGYVDKVLSTEVLKDFERELATLKKLSHIHIVEFVGSYTDPRYVGIIMSPVADCNLQEFLAAPSISNEHRSFLRTFFGCLTAALKYLHENRIRHKDIKPQNVLVKSHQVLLTDFGISRDWTELGRSTTTGPTFKTPRYFAPEVAASEPRNSSADIWSLGCIFLEIFSAMLGKTISQLNDHMTTFYSRSSCYYQNLESALEWCFAIATDPEHRTPNELREFGGSSFPAAVIRKYGVLGFSDKFRTEIFEPLQEPYRWILCMLKTTPTDRSNAQALFHRIEAANAHPDMPFSFTGLCCTEGDDTAESVQSSIYEPEVSEDQTATKEQRTITPLLLAKQLAESPSRPSSTTPCSRYYSSKIPEEQLSLSLRPRAAIDAAATPEERTAFRRHEQRLPERPKKRERKESLISVSHSPLPGLKDSFYDDTEK